VLLKEEARRWGLRPAAAACPVGGREACGIGTGFCFLAGFF
jgi:hypothetical protein